MHTIVPGGPRGAAGGRGCGQADGALLGHPVRPDGGILLCCYVGVSVRVWGVENWKSGVVSCRAGPNPRTTARSMDERKQHLNTIFRRWRRCCGWERAPSTKIWRWPRYARVAFCLCLCFVVWGDAHTTRANGWWVPTTAVIRLASYLRINMSNANITHTAPTLRGLLPAAPRRQGNAHAMHTPPVL